MVKFGAHAFVWTGDWTLESGNQTIERAAQVGFDFLEIPLLDPADFNAREHRAALEHHGIKASCSLGLPADSHMPSHPERATAFLLRVLEQMELLGSRYLCGCIGYSLGVHTGAAPTRAERAQVEQTLRTVALEADLRGITLALEAVNRYETYLYNTLEDVRDTVLEVGAPNLFVHADTYHMNIEEEGFYKPLVAVADKLDYIHMSESHRGLVGSGTVNWDEVWRGLRDAQFDGSLVLESFAAINPKLQAATCLWRPTKVDSDTLAGEGLTFLKQGAARAGLVPA